MNQQIPKHLLRDAALLFTGVRFLRTMGIQPTSFYGGTALGFFGGNMAAVYGFDARSTLKELQKIQS